MTDTPMTLVERVAHALAEYDTDIRDDLSYMEAAAIFIHRAGIQELIAQMKEMDAVLRVTELVLEEYADPTTYTDNSGKFLPADVKDHQGLLAEKALAVVRVVLTKQARQKGKRS